MAIFKRIAKYAVIGVQRCIEKIRKKKFIHLINQDLDWLENQYKIINLPHWKNAHIFGFSRDLNFILNDLKRKTNTLLDKIFGLIIDD